MNLKNSLSLLLAFLTLLALLACASTPAVPSPSVYALTGPTGMGIAKLNADSDGGGTKNAYQFTYASSPDAVVAAISSGEADIAAVPVNLAATLYKKTAGGVKVICANTLGVLYLLEDGETVRSVADLKGKTILATGQASTPEYILRYLLTKNGIDPDKDVTIEYSTELNSCGEGQIVLLPEPKVTLALSGNPNARIALNLTEEWEKVSEGALVQGVIIARTEFIEKHPQAVADFLTEYADSVKFTNEAPAEAAELIAKYGIVAKAALAQKAIPNCNIVCITGSEMKSALTLMYGMLYEASPKSVGGELPPDSFYYGAE